MDRVRSIFQHLILIHTSPPYKLDSGCSHPFPIRGTTYITDRSTTTTTSSRQRPFNSPGRALACQTPIGPFLPHRALSDLASSLRWAFNSTVELVETPSQTDYRSLGGTLVGCTGRDNFDPGLFLCCKPLDGVSATKTAAIASGRIISCHCLPIRIFRRQPLKFCLLHLQNGTATSIGTILLWACLLLEMFVALGLYNTARVSPLSCSVSTSRRRSTLQLRSYQRKGQQSRFAICASKMNAS